MSGQTGFSLVEALVTLLVISAGLGALAGFQAHAWSAGLAGARLDQAADLALERLDGLEADIEAGLRPAGGSDRPGDRRTRFRRGWRISGGPAPRMEVEIHWPDDPRPMTLAGRARHDALADDLRALAGP